MIPRYVDKKENSFVGIDPDYDNKIPEPKTFTPKELVEKLNKEEIWPTQGKTFSVKITQYWRWSTDYVSYEPTPFTLFYNDTAIGYLEQDFDDPFNKENLPRFEGFSPFEDCTVYQVRFIRECTGWTITV